MTSTPAANWPHSVTPLEPAESPTPPLGRWLALVAAVLGWAFDGFEMGVFALVAQPALGMLLPHPTEAAIGWWYGVIQAGFLVGAASGGVLLGWVGDRFGRVRAMIASILTYALCTAAGAFASSAEHLFACRFLAALGMGGEWALGLALVVETWPRRSRAWLAGTIGTSVNLGFIAVAGISLTLGELLASLETLLRNQAWTAPWADWLLAGRGWRLLLLTGALPALLTLFLRWLVPESWQWQAAAAQGATRYWANRDLLGVALAMLACLGIIFIWATSTAPLTRLVGTSVGYAAVLLGGLYPVRAYFRRTPSAPGASRMASVAEELARQPGSEPGQTLTAADWPALRSRLLAGAVMSGIPLLGTWGAIQWIPLWAGQVAGPGWRDLAALVSAFGGCLGGMMAALTAERWGWRRSYAFWCLLAGTTTIGLFQLASPGDKGFLVWVFVTGVAAGAFTGWLPVCLPQLYPTPVRSLSQGFAFNHGRILAAIGALQVGVLLGWFGGYPAACTVACTVYGVGLAISPWLPRPWPKTPCTL